MRLYDGCCVTNGGKMSVAGCFGLLDVNWGWFGRSGGFGKCEKVLDLLAFGRIRSIDGDALFNVGCEMGVFSKLGWVWKM